MNYLVLEIFVFCSLFFFGGGGGGVERVVYNFNFSNKYMATQVIYFFFSDIWQFVSFKEFDHLI